MGATFCVLIGPLKMRFPLSVMMRLPWRSGAWNDNATAGVFSMLGMENCKSLRCSENHPL